MPDIFGGVDIRLSWRSVMFMKKFTDIEELAENNTPSISLEVQRLLGKQLAAAYHQSNMMPPLDCFTKLLTRLDTALAEAKNSDERKFRVGLLESTTSLRSFAVSLARDPATADDLVQETMLRAWRSRHSFQIGTNQNAWLFTIMRNTFYTLHRKQKWEVSDSEGDHAGRLASLPEQGGHLDLQDVQAALGNLSPPMREALLLVSVENLSYEEAAGVMGCQIGTVKSRVWRARQELAVLLGYTGNEVGADRTMLSVLSMPGMAVGT